jgi:Spy/CpxP family protein refolding chaperone
MRDRAEGSLQMIRREVFAFSLAALSVAASGAFAQGRKGRGGAERAGGGEPVNMFEVTLHEFQEDLKLTAAQEPAWAAYVEKVRALQGDITRERRQTLQLGVLQRIDHAVDVARDRLTAVEDIALAAKALYGRLTPEQQAVADPRLANIITMPLTGTPAVASDRAPRPRGPVSN